MGALRHDLRTPEPTITALVYKNLRRRRKPVDPGTVAYSLGITYDQAAAALSHFYKYKVCSRFSIAGVLLYSLTGRDSRTYTVEYRRKEVKPRRKRGTVVYLAHLNQAKAPSAEVIRQQAEKIELLQAKITELNQAQEAQEAQGAQ